MKKFKEEDLRSIEIFETEYNDINTDNINEDSESTYNNSSEYSENYSQDQLVEFVENENINEEINSIIEIGSIYLEKYAKNSNLNEQHKKELKKSFCDWIIKSLDRITPNLQYIENDADVWALLSLRKEWRNLAEYATRVVTIPASEASCERFFSRQRLAIPKNRRMTSKKLEGARMSYL